ncbi:MAG TPA: GNAT family protein [candidate division Zixibacteria bacterium]|nr:GNAT family protein [candidate division Zixibacteria bacterium]
MFDGKKVSLRSFELEDIEIMMEDWNTIKLRRELGPVVPHSREERIEWIKKTWEERSTQKGYTFAIEDIKTKKLLGYASLKNVNTINRKATVSIAIFSEKNRGRGFGTDAMKVLLKIGFDYLNFHRIGLNVFDTNPQAIRVYEKAGFKKVGLLRDVDFVEGRYVNDVCMDILEHEWRVLKEKE